MIVNIINMAVSRQQMPDMAVSLTSLSMAVAFMVEGLLHGDVIPCYVVYLWVQLLVKGKENP